MLQRLAIFYEVKATKAGRVLQLGSVEPRRPNSVSEFWEQPNLMGLYPVSPLLKKTFFYLEIEICLKFWIKCNFCTASAHQKFLSNESNAEAVLGLISIILTRTLELLRSKEPLWSRIEHI